MQSALIAPLYGGDFTRHRGSIEAAFISDARFIVENFPDLSWNPLWYLGFPFEWFYTPLLPAAVAILGKLIDNVPMAYRVIAAAGYALGPPAVYIATLEVARSRAAAWLAAIAFVFVPSLSYVLPGLHADGAAFSGAALPPPWRLMALVEYGEGPHVLSLSLALLALAACLRHVREPSAGRLAVAVALTVAVAMTNLIGLLGVAVFVGLLPASERLGGRAEDRYARVFVIGVLAALLSTSWYSVGFIRAVLGFSTPGGSEGGTVYLFLPLLLVAALAAVAWLDRRLPDGLGLALGWLLAFGAILVARQFGGVALAPQPIRYALELDAAAAIALGIGAAAMIRAFTTRTSARLAEPAAALALTLLVGVPGAGGWMAVRDRLEPEAAWTSWSERRVALWLSENLLPGERAYLTGGHAFWLNAFADVPQVRGGVDFAFTNPWWAHVTYQVNVGADAGIATLWMQALPVRYIVVPGPSSSEIYRDFADVRKFDGRLPAVFDEHSVRIYEVPRVGDPNLVVARVADLKAPTSAVDADAVAAYVRRIAEGRAPTSMERRGLGTWRAVVDVADGEALLLRQAYDTGWRAWVDGRAAEVRSDPIGQLLVVVPPGRHVVELDHRVHGDLLAGLALATVTTVVLLGAWIRAGLRRRHG